MKAFTIRNSFMFLFIWVVILGLYGCWMRLPNTGNEQDMQKVHFPELDIVYSRSVTYGISDNTLWFVDNNGNQSVFVEIPQREKGVERPIFTNTNSQCIFTRSFPPKILSSIQNDESLRYHEELAPNMIGEATEYSAIYGSNYAIFLYQFSDNTWHLITYDFDNGSIIDDHQLPIRKEEWQTLDLGVNAQYDDHVVYTRIQSSPLYTELVLWDVKSDVEEILSAYNGYVVKDASFSPDGSQLAYYDDSQGIMVMELSGGRPGEIEVLLPYQQNDGSMSYTHQSPQPSWSPDGEWVVYHRQIDTSIHQASGGLENFAVYKLNVNTKEEVLLVNRGVYPFWRSDIGANDD